MKKLLVKLVICYAVMIAAMTGLMTLAHCIPANLTADNVASSISAIPNYQSISPSRFYSFDTFTDRVMVEEVKNIDTSRSLYSAMLCSYKYFMPFAMATDEIALDRADGGQDVVYSRYWHGYAIFLAPLLIFFDYSIIRWINFAIAAILMCIAGYLLVKRKGWVFMICFMLPLVYIGYPYEALCMQYMSAFAVAILTVIGVLLIKGDSCLTILFFISGGTLAFVDFLTFPMLTLCYPLIVALALDDNDTRVKFHRLIILVAAWGAGYGSIWMSKWILAQLITGLPIFTNALAALKYRSSSANIDPFFLQFRLFTKGVIFPGDVWIAFAIVMITIAIIFRRATIATLRINAPYLAVGLIPILWFAIVRNHSMSIFIFTWRAFAPTMLVLLLLLVSFIKTLRCRKQPY